MEVALEKENEKEKQVNTRLSRLEERIERLTKLMQEGINKKENPALYETLSNTVTELNKEAFTIRLSQASKEENISSISHHGAGDHNLSSFLASTPKYSERDYKRMLVELENMFRRAHFIRREMSNECQERLLDYANQMGEKIGQFEPNNIGCHSYVDVDEVQLEFMAYIDNFKSLMPIITTGNNFYFC